MLLFRTPLGCETFINDLPAHRAETYRSIRAPVVHVGAGDSSPCQRLSLDPALGREIRGILGLTVELFGLTSRVSAPDASRRSANERWRRRMPRPSGVPLHARPARPLLWIGTLPGRIRGARRSRRKWSPDGRRTVPPLGPSAHASAFDRATGSRVLADRHARSLEAQVLRARGSSIATLSSPSGERQPEAGRSARASFPEWRKGPVQLRSPHSARLLLHRAPPLRGGGVSTDTRWTFRRFGAVSPSSRFYPISGCCRGFCAEPGTKRSRLASSLGPTLSITRRRGTWTDAASAISRPGFRHLESPNDISCQPVTVRLG